MYKNLIFSCLLLSFLLSSCNSADLLNDRKNDKTTIPEKSDNAYYVRDDGSLSFSSLKAYQAVCDSLLQLSPAEFHEWENSIGFKSYRAITNEALEKLKQTTDTKSYNSVLKQYADYIYLSHDSLIYPNIECQYYKNIIDKNGIFYIEGIKNIVTKDHISAFKDGKKLSTYSYISDIPSTKSEQVLDAFPYIETKWDGRKIATKARFYRTLVTGGGAIIESYILELYAQGYINQLGHYKPYGTVLMFDDIVFRGKTSAGNIYQNTWPDVETADNTGSITVSIPVYFVNELVCLHYRARSRGTGNRGVAYNVYQHQFYDYNGVNKCDVHLAIGPTKTN